MKELVSSIKAQDAFILVTVRPEKDGNSYKIIASHCRMCGSELARLLVLEVEDINHQRGG